MLYDIFCQFEFNFCRDLRSDKITVLDKGKVKFGFKKMLLSLSSAINRPMSSRLHGKKRRQRCSSFCLELLDEPTTITRVGVVFNDNPPNTYTHTQMCVAQTGQA